MSHEPYRPETWMDLASEHPFPDLEDAKMADPTPICTHCNNTGWISPGVRCHDRCPTDEELQLGADLKPQIAVETYKPAEPFLAEHKRRPTAKRDGIAAWLRDEIAYLESIQRTNRGDGALSAYKATLTELERANNGE